MNKKLIKKYRAEFDHWLDGGSLLTNLNDFSFEWDEVTESNSWSVFTRIYVINDEYVEFRKALAEGKIIQWNSNYNKSYEHWVDVCDQTDKMFNLYTADIMRIKPAEPAFKVGDWIRSSTTKLLLGKIAGFSSTNVPYIISGEDKIIPNTFELELWTPEFDEWCVFRNTYGAHYTIDRFEKTEIFAKDAINAKKDKYWAKSIDTWFQEIYPLEFINTLKE